MNKKASQIRYEKSVKEMAKQRFWKHPQSLPEAIAKHYMAHAVLALQIGELIKQKRAVPEITTTADKLIEKLVETIKTNHVADFGTELIDTVSPEAKRWRSYLEELDGVE